MAARTSTALAVALGLALAGCSGMNGGGMTPGVASAPAQAPAEGAPVPGAPDAETPESDASPSAQPSSSAEPPAGHAGSALLPAIAAASRGQANPALDAAVAIGTLGAAIAAYATDAAGPKKGVCRAGFEFFAPDRAGDANSTESLNYLDARCTHLARDTVRRWTAGTTHGSETVTRSVKIYASGNAAPVATRTDDTSFANATFDAYGFPVYAAGFQRTTSSRLSAGTKSVALAGDEMVLSPSTANAGTYCSDSAGYGSSGIAKLGLAFGWQGQVSSGTRTSAPGSSITWSATHAGQTQTGAIGNLHLSTGTANAGCPISKPLFTLAGAAPAGSYGIPLSVTFKDGVVRKLAVSKASLASGDTLAVATNGKKAPGNGGFVTGTLSNGSTTIASFTADAFGNGTLTIASTGVRLTLVDWNVVR